jgi:hypothetical protein
MLTLNLNSYLHRWITQMLQVHNTIKLYIFDFLYNYKVLKRIIYYILMYLYLIERDDNL